jgi:hypothetical protein
MTGHVCMDVATMCDACQDRAIDAYEHVNDEPPMGWEP